MNACLSLSDQVLNLSDMKFIQKSVSKRMDRWTVQCVLGTIFASTSKGSVGFPWKFCITFPYSLSSAIHCVDTEVDCRPQIARLLRGPKAIRRRYKVARKPILTTSDTTNNEKKRKDCFQIYVIIHTNGTSNAIRKFLKMQQAT